MPTIPCDKKINCCCDGSPLIGLDAAAIDVPNFLGIGYASILPNLGLPGPLTACFSTAIASDQQTADLLAERNATLCSLNELPLTCPSSGSPSSGGGGGGGGGQAAFFNQPQSCTVTCPDGLPFTFTVPAGVFVSTTQLDANAQAFSFACNEAAIRAICLSALTPNTAQEGVPYSGTITATGGSLAGPGQNNNWSIVSGSLPSGLTFHGGSIPSASVSITGTPTVAGTFNFAVECTTPTGDSMTKSYTLTVAACVIGYTITLNQGGWALIGSTPPFDTSYFSNTASVNPVQDFKAVFNSPTLKTWNWNFTSPDNTFIVKINGVAVGPATFNGSGSFTTNGCSGTTFEIVRSSVGFGRVELDWQTPT